MSIHMDSGSPVCYSSRMATTERPLRKDAERNRQRILEAANELFTQRGLGVTLNDIAHYAGCGVGTVYRRFPDKEQLIDALFQERVAELLARAEEAVANPDPWEGLVGFLEQTLELQTRDRGLKELLLSTDEGRSRAANVRELLTPIVGQLIERAHASGALRPDVTYQDMPVVQVMLGAVIDGARGIEPELWRRYLAIVLRGLRADPTPPETLPVGPLTEDQLEDVMRCWQPPPRHR
jgi:AcrR family transcriptional regulator